MQIRIKNKDHEALIRAYAKERGMPINKAVVMAIYEAISEPAPPPMDAHEILKALRKQFAPKYKNPIK